MLGGAGLLENDDRRRDQGVAKLDVGRAISVNVQKLDVLGQIGFDGGSVIHVHEFRRDQPDGEAAGCHPGIAEQQEMGVEPGQAADVEAGSGRRPAPSAAPCRLAPDGDAGHRADWSGSGYRPGRGRAREIAGDDPQAGCRPEAFGGGGEGGSISTPQASAIAWGGNTRRRAE